MKYGGGVSAAGGGIENRKISEKRKLNIGWLTKAESESWRRNG